MTPPTRSALPDSTAPTAGPPRLTKRIISPLAARPAPASAASPADGSTAAFPRAELAAPLEESGARVVSHAAADPAISAATPPSACWSVLVVDDEPAIHQVTRLALSGVEVLGRPLRLLHATSGALADEMLRDNPDVALILLDVVMEHDSAGLDFVRQVRREIGNTAVRIVLRTGQPGQAPEREVMIDYDINDYKEKTELTMNRLFTTVVAGIRTYRDIRALQRTQAGLASMAQASVSLFGTHDTASFAAEVLREVEKYGFFDAGTLLDVRRDGGQTTAGGLAMQSLAARCTPGAAPFQMPPELLAQVLVKQHVLTSAGVHHVASLRTGKDNQILLGLRASRALEDDERQVLDLFVRNVVIAFDNLLLEQEAAMLARLPAELPDPILRVSSEGRVLFANDASAHLLRHWGTSVGGVVPAGWATRLREVIALDRRLDTEVNFNDRVLELTMSPVPEVQYVNLFGRDVTEYRELLSRLQHAAFHDELTGLHNRVHFRAALEQAISEGAASGNPVGLLLIDLDQFKQINDTMGHAAGDEALRIAGKRLMQMVRTGDTVARLGGDEFAVLVHQLDQPEELEGLAERLRTGLTHPMPIGSRDWTVGASIGITSYPRDATNASDLLRCADLAMYHVKRDGSGGVSAYDGEVHKSVRQRTSVEMLLRDALKHDRMGLHYQPVVELGTGRILGAEALVRLRSADGTPISPVEFIPVAEECGLIDQLGEWVLHRALTDTHRWHVQGHANFRIAVNVSGRQLRDPGIVQRFREVLDSTGVNSSRLEIELTESVLVGNAHEAMARIWDLRGLGADLSVDDFGTGYSSLGYLRSLPVSKLKIDRSFVMDLPGNRDALAIVDAVLSLSRSLRLNVVAEGVETQEQAATLREMGCGQGQGYLFSRPVPVEDFERLLQHSTLPAKE